MQKYAKGFLFVFLTLHVLTTVSTTVHRLLPTVFPRLIASAAKTPSLRLTHSQVFKAWRMVGQSSGRNPNGSGKDWELEGTKSDEETISEKEVAKCRRGCRY